jgi:hypothetical protein
MNDKKKQHKQKGEKIVSNVLSKNMPKVSASPLLLTHNSCHISSLCILLFFSASLHTVYVLCFVRRGGILFGFVFEKNTKGMLFLCCWFWVNKKGTKQKYFVFFKQHATEHPSNGTKKNKKTMTCLNLDVVAERRRQIKANNQPRIWDRISFRKMK